MSVWPARRLQVLQAIVEDYVLTEEPVGSKSLVQRHSLPVSPATIRNEMAALEEEGLIAQPHTSAGRIPTDRGYRVFVDHLAQVKPLSAPERRAIEVMLNDAVDLDDVVMRSVKLLAQLTHQVAVIQYPSLRRTSMRHLELVTLSPDRVLIIVITDAGRVEQRGVELSAELNLVEAAEIAAVLNDAATGLRGSDLTAKLSSAAKDVRPELEGAAQQIVDQVIEMIRGEVDERIAVAGAANLARANNSADFLRSYAPVLDALEEQVVLLRLLADMADQEDRVSVVIGAENQMAALQQTSIITTGYGNVEQSIDGPLGRVGTLGPTRINYAGTIAAVRAVARYLSRAIENS